MSRTSWLNSFVGLLCLRCHKTSGMEALANTLLFTPKGRFLIYSIYSCLFIEKRILEGCEIWQMARQRLINFIF
jgi:hypothetical protein